MGYKKVALSAKQLKCIQLMVYTNKTQVQIAEEIGVNKSTITVWMNNEMFKEALEKETRKSLGNLSQKAVRKLGELIDSNNPIVALSACKGILNKSGYKETEKIEQTTKVIEVEVAE